MVAYLFFLVMGTVVFTRSVHAGDAVLRGDGTALRAAARDRGRRTRGRGRRRGAGQRGVGTEHDLDVARRHRGVRGRGHAVLRGDLGGVGRVDRGRTCAVEDLGRGERAGVPYLPGLEPLLDQRGLDQPGQALGVAAVVDVHDGLGGV